MTRLAYHAYRTLNSCQPEPGLQELRLRNFRDLESRAHFPKIKEDVSNHSVVGVQTFKLSKNEHLGFITDLVFQYP